MTFPARTDRLTTLLLGLAVGAGLAGAFVGLGRNSFWYDELFTAWVIGDAQSLTGTISRLLTDLHPPLFYLSLFSWAQIMGVSDAALRSFSALCAVGAVALFLWTTRRSFGLDARLFAMAVAVHSSFWLTQSQNARSYTLTMVFVTLMLGLGLAIAREARLGRSIGPLLATLALLTGVGAFVHFYVMMTALALLAVLFVAVPASRCFALVWGAVLAAGVLLYVERVIAPNALFSIEHSWIGSSPDWYATETTRSATATLNRWAALPVLLCLGLATRALWNRRLSDERRDQLMLCVGVPLLVIIGGVLNSVLLRPSFTNSNILVASPFIWGAVALAYDIGIGSVARKRWGSWLALGLALMMLGSASRVGQRLQPHNTPFRDSAAWIAARQGCRGAAIPVFFTRAHPMRPGGYGPLARNIYARYLPPTMPPAPFEIGPGAEPATATPVACPVVAWASGYVGDAADAARIAQALAEARGAGVAVRSFGVPGSDAKAYVFLKRD